MRFDLNFKKTFFNLLQSKLQKSNGSIIVFNFLSITIKNFEIFFTKFFDKLNNN